MQHFHKNRAIVLGAVFMLLLTLLPGLAQAATVAVEGRLLTLDLAARKIGLKNAAGDMVSLNVPTTLKVRRNGVVKRLSGLVLGDEVQASYNSATQNALAVNATGPATNVTRAQIVSVASNTGIVTVTTDRSQRRYRVDAQTRIARNGQPVWLRDLTTRDRGTVAVIPGRNVLAALTVNGPEDDEIHGTISAIVDNHVTITPLVGAAVTVHAVAGLTLIDIEDVPATLADLAVGQRAEADFSPTSHNAFRIHAELDDGAGDDEIEGTITAIGASSITIQPPTGASLTLGVNVTTQISFEDQPVALADLPLGVRAEADYDPTTLVAITIRAEDDNGGGEGDDEVEGTVTAVDVAGGSLTIQPAVGNSVTLTVDASTQITFEDQPATLANIPVGARAEADYHPTTLVAITIRAEDDGPDD